MSKIQPFKEIGKAVTKPFQSAGNLLTGKGNLGDLFTVGSLLTPGGSLANFGNFGKTTFESVGQNFLSSAGFGKPLDKFQPKDFARVLQTAQGGGGALPFPGADPRGFEIPGINPNAPSVFIPWPGSGTIGGISDLIPNKPFDKLQFADVAPLIAAGISQSQQQPGQPGGAPAAPSGAGGGTSVLSADILRQAIADLDPAARDQIVAKLRSDLDRTANERGEIGAARLVQATGDERLGEGFRIDQLNRSTEAGNEFAQRINSPESAALARRNQLDLIARQGAIARANQGAANQQRLVDEQLRQPTFLEQLLDVGTQALPQIFDRTGGGSTDISEVDASGMTEEDVAFIFGDGGLDRSGELFRRPA